MKIQALKLTNFKRFTELTIEQIPETSKLVLLIGANGSGKSSVFDAFGYVDSFIKGDLDRKVISEYFNKYPEKDLSLSLAFFGQEKNVKLSSRHNEIPLLPKNTFYGRSSFRQVSRLSRMALGQVAFNVEKDTDRPKFFIDRDLRFENDIEKITEVILKEIFISAQTGEEIKRQFINPINQAFENVFGNQNGTKLELLEIIPPLDNKAAQINFRKGESEMHYNLLSAGEKEVFNILINLLSRRPFFTDTIYFFDEIDLHLNTSLQFKLLKEITENWIPDNCQLWTASHSLGFIEYASQSESASIIDFDNLDFDQPHTLTPVPKGKPEVYEIAVGKDFLSTLFKNISIYFVENKDQKFYGSVQVPQTVFVAERDKSSVFHKARSTEFKGLIDRDFLSDSDIEKIEEVYSNLKILRYYSIENYMYHPENLEAYYQSQEKDFDKEAYINELIQEKNKIKSMLTLKIATIRLGYPFFKEPTVKDKLLKNRFKSENENFNEAEQILSYLESDQLEDFYKVFPMKDYATHLPARQHIAKSDLVKTEWFKVKLQELLGS